MISDHIGIAAFLWREMKFRDLHMPIKNKAEALSLFLFRFDVECFFSATAAEFLDLHLIRMSLFVSCSNVISFATFTACEDYLVTLRFCHIYSHFFLSAWFIVT